MLVCESLRAAICCGRHASGRTNAGQKSATTIMARANLSASCSGGGCRFASRGKLVARATAASGGELRSGGHARFTGSLRNKQEPASEQPSMSAAPAASGRLGRDPNRYAIASAAEVDHPISSAPRSALARTPPPPPPKKKEKKKENKEEIIEFASRMDECSSQPARRMQSELAVSRSVERQTKAFASALDLVVVVVVVEHSILCSAAGKESRLSICTPAAPAEAEAPGQLKQATQRRRATRGALNPSACFAVGHFLLY